MISDSVFGRTKNKKIGNFNKTKMCQVGRSKLNIAYVICALTIFNLATYNLDGLFCNALPPVAQDIIEDIEYDSDILTDTKVIEEESSDKDDGNEKISPSSSYMDHKGLFCGTRMSDLVTLNVTSR